MKNPFKRKYLPIMCLLITMSANANANEWNRLESCETSCCDTEECRVYFSGELLYWRPELCGLDSAFGDTTIATFVDSNANIITSVTESDREPHSKWNPGYRVGGGLLCNGFDVNLEYTHFDGCAHFKDHGQHGHWKIKYETIDLTFGRPFEMSSCFYVKPFIGVRGLYIEQKLKSHLETLFTSIIGNNIVTSDLNDREKFWGVGPEIGFDADWRLGCGLSLYGSFDVVTYYGEVKGKNHDTNTFTQTINISNGKKKRCFNTVATDAAIGIRWDSTSDCFCGCELDLMLKLGLEQHRIYDFSDLGSDGTLSLDGGVFAAGIGFKF